MARVGVIGLGRMGAALAQRMAAEGVSVTGWTRSGRAVEGVETASDLGQLVSASDALVLSLLDDTAVAGTLDALLDQDLAGKIIIETSTVTPGVLTDRIDRIRTAGADAVDAPIAGGPELVLSGNCGFYVGGEDAAAERAREVLSAVSSRFFHVGPLGAGLVMKVINNGMIMAYFNGLSDLLPLAQRAGLPLETALRILCGGPAGLPMIADRIPKVLGEDKSIGFALSAAFKDNDVFSRVVASFGLTSPMLENFAARKGDVEAAGLMDRDPAELLNLAYYGRGAERD